MANMPCNPSIRGSAKGIVVREIDALGGMMAKGADKGAIQIKMLNTGKGPCVQCLRSQSDKIDYPKIMHEYAFNTPNLELMEGMVDDLLHDDNPFNHGPVRPVQSFFCCAVRKNRCGNFCGKYADVRRQRGPSNENRGVGRHIKHHGEIYLRAKSRSDKQNYRKLYFDAP